MESVYRYANTLKILSYQKKFKKQQKIEDSTAKNLKCLYKKFFTYF